MGQESVRVRDKAKVGVNPDLPHAAMPAQVVYDGVNGRYEGTLFNGVKFWVAQRVPTRNHILSQITASRFPSSGPLPHMSH